MVYSKLDIRVQEARKQRHTTKINTIAAWLQAHTKQKDIERVIVMDTHTQKERERESERERASHIKRTHYSSIIMHYLVEHYTKDYDL